MRIESERQPIPFASRIPSLANVVIGGADEGARRLAHVERVDGRQSIGICAATRNRQARRKGAQDLHHLGPCLRRHLDAHVAQRPHYCAGGIGEVGVSMPEPEVLVIELVLDVGQALCLGPQSVGLVDLSFSHQEWRVDLAQSREAVRKLEALVEQLCDTIFNVRIQFRRTTVLVVVVLVLMVLLVWLASV